MNIDPIASGENSFASDLLHGAKSIGDFIGEDEKRVYYLAQKGYLPIGRIGATLIASKKALRAHYERLTQGMGEAQGPSPPRHIHRSPHRGKTHRSL